jgi:hypothetical protein
LEKSGSLLQFSAKSASVASELASVVSEFASFVSRFASFVSDFASRVSVFGRSSGFLALGSPDRLGLLGKRSLRRPNAHRFTCAAGAHVPKPTRRGRCRGGRAKTQPAICNGRVAVILVC